MAHKIVFFLSLLLLLPLSADALSIAPGLGGGMVSHGSQAPELSYSLLASLETRQVHGVSFWMQGDLSRYRAEYTGGKDSQDSESLRILSLTSSESSISYSTGLAYTWKHTLSLSLLAGYHRMHLDSRYYDFTGSGPYLGARISYPLLQKKIKLGMAYTPYGNTSVSGGLPDTVPLQGSSAGTLSGDPNWELQYRISAGPWDLFRIPVELGYKGTTLRFDRQYRYYHSLFFSLPFQILE